jgi:hypothetical protein
VEEPLVDEPEVEVPEVEEPLVEEPLVEEPEVEEPLVEPEDEAPGTTEIDATADRPFRVAATATFFWVVVAVARRVNCREVDPAGITTEEGMVKTPGGVLSSATVAVLAAALVSVTVQLLEAPEVSVAWAHWIFCRALVEEPLVEPEVEEPLVELEVEEPLVEEPLVEPEEVAPGTTEIDATADRPFRVAARATLFWVVVAAARMVNCREADPAGITTEEGMVKTPGGVLSSATVTVLVAALVSVTVQLLEASEVSVAWAHWSFCRAPVEGVSVEGVPVEGVPEEVPDRAESVPPVPVTGSGEPVSETPRVFASPTATLPGAVTFTTATTPAVKVFLFGADRMQVYRPAVEEQESDFPAAPATAPGAAVMLEMLAAGYSKVH